MESFITLGIAALFAAFGAFMYCLGFNRGHKKGAIDAEVKHLLKVGKVDTYYR